MEGGSILGDLNILNSCTCESAISQSPTFRRRHFRQFCHCHCSCIHKCHHKNEQCAEETERISSPKMAAPFLMKKLSTLSLPPSNLPTESIAVVIDELRNTGKKRISDFIIEKDLGEGAYAFVKQARYRDSNTCDTSFAIKMVIKDKILSECILHDSDCGLSLPVELYALRLLKEHPHPNIVSMIDAFEDLMYYYIQMPMHGKGEDLFEIIEKSPDFLPPTRVANIFSQVAMAVSHLHNFLGLVHRDIKDENIIIDENDRIQLIDFGSCAYYRKGPMVQENIPLTEADIRLGGDRDDQYHTFHGTADYAPPEVLKGEPYDGPPQDMWALGVLLYTLSFKEFPFRSKADIMEGKLRLPFSPSPEIGETIKELLSSRPEDRIAAAELVRKDWIVKSYSNMIQSLKDTVNKTE